MIYVLHSKFLSCILCFPVRLFHNIFKGFYLGDVERLDKKNVMSRNVLCPLLQNLRTFTSDLLHRKKFLIILFHLMVEALFLRSHRRLLLLAFQQYCHVVHYDLEYQIYSFYMISCVVWCMG